MLQLFWDVNTQCARSNPLIRENVSYLIISPPSLIGLRCLENFFWGNSVYCYFVSLIAKIDTLRLFYMSLAVSQPNMDSRRPCPCFLLIYIHLPRKHSKIYFSFEGNISFSWMTNASALYFLVYWKNARRLFLLKMNVRSRCQILIPFLDTVIIIVVLRFTLEFNNSTPADVTFFYRARCLSSLTFY